MKGTTVLLLVGLCLVAATATPFNTLKFMASISPRADSCATSGERSCSADCEYITYCSLANNWIVIDKCPANTLCHYGECVAETTYICGASGAVSCGQSSAGHNFPSLEDCSTYYYCAEDWSTPAVQKCNTGYYYDPLANNCTLRTASQCDQYSPCTGANNGLDAVVFGNPSLHYLCMANTTVLSKCAQGFYDPKVGECVGIGRVSCDA